MEKVRGFEIAKGFEDKGINLPKRATINSAGYDIESAETIVIPSVWEILRENLGVEVTQRIDVFQQEIVRLILSGEGNEKIKPVLVKTGIKAYMPEDEALFLYNRSSNPLDRFLILANGVGVIDSDYYENPKNDGQLHFQFINIGFTDITIKKGDRIGQGIFKKFLKVDNDESTGKKRIGGLGHSGI